MLVGSLLLRKTLLVPAPNSFSRLLDYHRIGFEMRKINFFYWLYFWITFLFNWLKKYSLKLLKIRSSGREVLNAWHIPSTHPANTSETKKIEVWVLNYEQNLTAVAESGSFDAINIFEKIFFENLSSFEFSTHSSWQSRFSIVQLAAKSWARVALILN